MYYILEGPADCGNAFGYFKPGLVPERKFAVVSDSEYSNGGYGPCSVDGKVWSSREAAEKALNSHR